MPKPTREDAKLLLKYITMVRSDEDYRKAAWWYTDELKEMSYQEFKAKYPAGSEGSRNFRLVAGYYEVLGALVDNALLSEDLVFDVFGFEWKKAEAIIHGMRKESKWPALFENFEVLAKKQAAWDKKHKPKV